MALALLKGSGKSVYASISTWIFSRLQKYAPSYDSGLIICMLIFIAEIWFYIFVS